MNESIYRNVVKEILSSRTNEGTDLPGEDLAESLRILAKFISEQTSNGIWPEKLISKARQLERLEREFRDEAYRI